MQGMPGSRENALYAETIWETKVMTETTFIFSSKCREYFHGFVFMYKSSCLLAYDMDFNVCVRVYVCAWLKPFNIARPTHYLLACTAST